MNTFSLKVFISGIFVTINTLSPEQNYCHFAEEIFKSYFLEKISIQIFEKWFQMV